MKQKPASGGMHEDLSESVVENKTSNAGFGKLFFVVFGLLGGYLLWIEADPWSYIFLALSAVFLILTFLWPGALGPLNQLWFRFGGLLHKVTSPIILGLLFGIFILFGCCRRLVGADPLGRRRHGKADSYWVVRDPAGPTPESIRRQF